MMKTRGLGRIYKRGNMWWIEYSFRGEEHRESSHSAKQKAATDLLKKRLGEIGRGRLVGPQAERVTLSDLARMVLDDYGLKGRKSVPPLARLRDYFPNHTRAIDMTPDVVRSYVQHRLGEGAAAQTVKHEVGILSRAFALAVEAGLLPYRPRFPMPRVSNARSGFFTDAEVGRLLEHLPAYLRPLTEAAYITGWRRGELIGLRWSQVDWETGTIRLERGTTKSGEPRSFPFSAHPRLAEILRGLREETSALERSSESLCPWVLHREGRQVRGWYYDGWRTACKKAGVPGRLFHDLRRSAVRNLIRASVSENVAMSITGHKTRSVFDRYHIVSSQDQTEAVRKLAALQDATVKEPRKVVNLEEARAERTRTVPAQLRPRDGSSRLQRVANGGSELASPTGFEPVSPP